MKRRPLHENLSSVLSLVMAVVYLGGGILLISSSSSFSLFPGGDGGRVSFALALIAYGVFRGYRGWKGLQEFKDQ